MRRTTILLCSVLVAGSMAAAAHAQPCITPGIPCPALSVMPNCLMLLPGPADFYTDPSIGFYQPYTLTVVDGFGAGIVGIPVVFDFTAATDVSISVAQIPAVAPACGPPKTLTVITGAGGTVTFVARGAALNGVACGGPPLGGFGQVTVSALGVPLRNITAVAADEDALVAVGVNGLSPRDFAFLLCDIFNRAFTAGRSDFNCSGRADPVDGSLWRQLFFNDPVSGAPQATVYCP